MGVVAITELVVGDRPENVELDFSGSLDALNSQLLQVTVAHPDGPGTPGSGPVFTAATADAQINN